VEGICLRNASVIVAKSTLDSTSCNACFSENLSRSFSPQRATCPSISAEPWHEGKVALVKEGEKERKREGEEETEKDTLIG